MRKTAALISAVLIPASLLVGCSSSNSSTSSASSSTPAAAAPATKPAIPIPAGSPFAKIKTGMSMGEVEATIGLPTNKSYYATGKAWIPFHYGGDNSRCAAYYKGQGIVTYSQDSAFSSGYSVMEVDYDPNEPGYSR